MKVVNKNTTIFIVIKKRGLLRRRRPSTESGDSPYRWRYGRRPKIGTAMPGVPGASNHPTGPVGSSTK